MGTRITAKGVDAEAYATEMGVPVRTGIRGIFLTNTDDTKATWNYAPGSSGRGLSVGPPTYTSQYGNFDGLAGGVPKYVDTKIIESTDFTYICAFKVNEMSNPAWPATPPGAAMPSELRAMVMSCYGSSAQNYGSCIYLSRNNGMAGLIGVMNEDGSKVSLSNQVVIDPSKWNIVSVRYSTALRAITIKNHITGAVVVGPLATGQTRIVSTQSIRIGCAPTGPYGGKSMVAMSQVHNIALGDSDTDRNANFIRAYCERKGISFL